MFLQWSARSSSLSLVVLFVSALSSSMLGQTPTAPTSSDDPLAIDQAWQLSLIHI